MAKSILVLGDIMFDQYTRVMTTRNAAEADIPVWDELRTETRLGGAANVANNLKSLAIGQEFNIYLAGICPRNYRMRALRSHIEKHGIDVSLVGGSDVMIKHRYVQDSKIIFRADNLKKFDTVHVQEFERFFLKAVSDLQVIYNFDLVIISDYDKGTVTEECAAKVLSMGIPVVVDSKRQDLSVFQGADVLKLNEKEYDVQTAHPKYTNVERLFKYVVVTRGAKGAELKMGDPVKTTGNRYVVHTEQFPGEPQEAVDVTGCGDTHTAAMGFSLTTDPDVRRAVKFANACAATVVRKFGTSTV